MTDNLIMNTMNESIMMETTQSEGITIDGLGGQRGKSFELKSAPLP